MSKLRTSKIFTVLSVPGGDKRSVRTQAIALPVRKAAAWERSPKVASQRPSDDIAISLTDPGCAKNFLMNSISWGRFFQNLIMPSCKRKKKMRHAIGIEMGETEYLAARDDEIARGTGGVSYCFDVHE